MNYKNFIELMSGYLPLAGEFKSIEDDKLFKDKFKSLNCKNYLFPILGVLSFVGFIMYFFLDSYHSLYTLLVSVLLTFATYSSSVFFSDKCHSLAVVEVKDSLDEFISSNFKGKSLALDGQLFFDAANKTIYRFMVEDNIEDFDTIDLADLKEEFLINMKIVEAGRNPA